MKLISLNVWGGKNYKELMDFIKNESFDTDIFSFQEVFDTTENPVPDSEYKLDLYKQLGEVLNEFQGYFISTVDNYIAGSFSPDFIDFNLSWGQAIFVKKNIKIKSHGDFYVYGSKETFDPKDWNSFPRVVLHVTIEENNKLITIGNLHGVWVKGGKNDTPSRILQSNMVNDFFDSQEAEGIFCGDFNLNMNTESIRLLEKNMRNLVKEYNIQTTRNKFFPGEEKFADYTFVSPGIKVLKFEVPNSDVSDHLPMILEFS